MDALRVFELNKPDLDQAYLDRWAESLGVEDELERIRREAREI